MTGASLSAWCRQPTTRPCDPAPQQKTAELLAGPVDVEGTTATLRLVHATDPTLDGSVTADLEYCAILDLQVPGRRTTLTDIEHTISVADQRLLQRVDPRS